jgi:putative transcriptional regulator
MLTPSEIGPLIRELRYRLGLTPDKLAAKLDVSPQTIHRWEHDQAWGRPSGIVMQKIEQALRQLGPRGEDLRVRYLADENCSECAPQSV